MYLNDRKQDLRRRGAQGHQCEVGHSLIPDSHCCYCCFAVGFGDGHLFLLQGQKFVKMSKMLSPLNSYTCSSYCNQDQCDSMIIHCTLHNYGFISFILEHLMWATFWLHLKEHVGNLGVVRYI